MRKEMHQMRGRRLWLIKGRPFGHLRRREKYTERKKKIHRKERSSVEKKYLVSGKFRCIWGFGFVSVLSLFCILPF
jgi:hypothetical protein